MKEKNFEQKLNELEEISEKLESESDIEEAVKLYEKGKKLAKECKHTLDEAQQKVIEISE